MSKTVLLKKYSKYQIPLYAFPINKVLKLHRSKWKNIQKLILKDQHKLKKLRFKFYNLQFCNLKRWERLSNTFKNILLSKKTLQTLFFNFLRYNFFKSLFIKNKYKDINSYRKIFLINGNYRLDILLFKLGFFKKLFFSKSAIFNKKIFLNSKIVQFANVLSKGDIIDLNFIKIDLMENKINDSIYLFSFLEVDFYTNQVIIVKNPSELTDKDFFLIFRSFISIFNLIDYLKK